MDIIERVYKPQNKADKIKSLYMHHYDDTGWFLNKKTDSYDMSPVSYDMNHISWPI